ncbi:MAG: alcohol dehydrogenase [Candidatus Diapherotrites archaeon CG08_land_8_20_14_0_20_34_12]|nr:MAG: alcohol dehydrogenase [Candidatus Diapherotrites archaeon CG08_land_8_20_14_0_20_34_12]
MKVAMYYNNNDVRIEEMQIPEISKDEILVKVISSGICGSDVLEWYRIKTAPRVLGHEISGEIIQVGKKVKKFRKGEGVFVSHHVPCGNCHYCKQSHHTACETLHKTNFYPGGFSQYLQVPKINVEKGTFLLPKEVSFDDATFIEPLGCVVRGQRLADIKSAESLLVLGSGISGLLHIKLAKSLGIKKIFATDISEFRLNFAKKLGAIAIDARENIIEKIKSFNNGLLVDRVIVCTGASSAIEQSFNSIERGGTILFFAVPKPEDKTCLSLSNLWRNEITLKTSYAASPLDLEEAINLIKSKKVTVSDLITHNLPLDEAQKGFRLVAKADESMKVILNP